MAVKEFKAAKKSYKKTPAQRVRLAISVAVVVLFAATLFGCIIPNFGDADDYSEQIAQIEMKTAALEAESQEISDSLGNEMELFEKIAREEYEKYKPIQDKTYRSDYDKLLEQEIQRIEGKKQ